MNPVPPAGRWLVVTAVAAERDAVLAGLAGAGVDVRVVAAGVGAAAAAAVTATELARAGGGGFQLVVSAGIGGGFVSVAPVGSLVLASELVAADLGVETSEGFVALDALGFGTTRYPVRPELADRLRAVLAAGPVPVGSGPVLTVQTVTGSAATAAELAARHPGAAAEAMEGFGVATAAAAHQVPVCELRAISNPVGPRDRDAWRIPAALSALTSGFSLIARELR